MKPLKGEDGHGHDHGHGGSDPHAWQSIGNAKIYVAQYPRCADRGGCRRQGRLRGECRAPISSKLDALEAEIKGLVAGIPPERRRIITSHDAFRYFEAAYGIDFVAPQGVSTEAEASAKDVARIIQQIRREKIARRLRGERLRCPPDGAHRQGDRRQDRRPGLFRRALGAGRPRRHLH